MIAFDDASRLSPSRIRVNRPYRSVMWCGFHGGSSLSFGDHRNGELGSGEHHERDGRGRTRRDEQPQQPQDLEDGDPGGVELGCPAAIPPGRDGSAQPLGHHRHTHDHVTDDHQSELVVHERGPDPGRQHQHAGHLQERQYPVQPVVGFEGGCEPREVHPRPPDGEEHERIRDQAVDDVVLGQRVVKLDSRDTHRDHEHQIEEELERAGGPSRFIGIAWSHGVQV